MKTDGKKPTLKKNTKQKKDKQNNKRNQQEIPNHTHAEN